MEYSKHFTQNLSRDTTEQIISAYVLVLTVNSFFQFSLQTYQQMGGGQYGKGPMAILDTKLCQFIENETVVYPSLKKASNFPEKCTFKKVTMLLVKAL